MNILPALIIMAVVQALAEFLPVSSSGHLVICENIPWIKHQLDSLGGDYTLFINVALHIATLAAVLIYLRSDIARLLRGSVDSLRVKDWNGAELRSIGYILAASVPAGILGILLHDHIEALFSSPRAVFFMLILNGLILISSKLISIGIRKLEDTGVPRSIMVGFFQALAIVPGISRSGLTITGGFLAGMEPIAAAKFSFFMAVPVIAGAGLLEGLKAARAGFPDGLLIPLAGAMLIALILGLLSLKLLMALVKRIRIDVFGYYTITIGIAGLVILRFL